MKFVKPKVIIFNMTPRSGKDIACEHLSKKYTNAIRLAFKDELIKVAASILGIHVGRFLQGYEGQTASGHWLKDVPMYAVNGNVYSKRTWLQHVSEVVIKPLVGNDVFGKAVSRHITDPEALYLISDGGFEEEVQAVMKVADVLILQRDRLNNNWEGDSRSWVNPSNAVIKHCPDAVQSEEEYLEWVDLTVNSWLNK